MIKLNNLILFYSSFLFCLVNGPGHETIKRKKFSSTNFTNVKSFTNDA